MIEYSKTIDYVRNYKGNPKELLVIVAWTTYERLETVAVERKHDNGYTEWESLDIEYTSMLMNDLNPNGNDN